MKKIFFGWYIVAAAILLAAYNSTMFIYGFTAFVTPMAATFGWSYAQLSLGSSIRGLEAGTLDPLIGIAADRWPAKRLMLIGICLSALGVILISQSASLAMFYIGFVVAGLGGAISTTMVPQIVVARWFRKNIGRASGVLAMGVPIGGLFVPLLVKVIDAYGWQTTLIYLTAGLLILGIPLSFLFRNRPEDYGLLPDGKAQGDIKDSSTYDISIGVKEAVKTRAFWYIGIASMFQMTAMNAVVLHLMPYLTSLGIERATAAIGSMALSMATLSARIPFGVLGDIFKKKYMMALSLGLTSAGLAIFNFIDDSSFAFVVLVIIVYGIGTSGAAPLRAPIIGEYFGIRKFGTIFGLVAVFTSFGQLAGAPIAGWMFDTRGAYAPIWLVFSGLTTVGMILMLILPQASRKLSPGMN